MTPSWSTACPEWRERLLDGGSLIPFEPLFPDSAAAALEIFTSLQIVDAPGRPSFAGARPWILDLVAAIFGAYDPLTATQLVNRILLLIAKKNGKSTLAAGLMLTAQVLNWRESGEFYILAPTKEIADNSYIPARDMTRAHPVLSTLLKPAAGRVIEHRNTGAILKVIAADSETVTGKKTIGLLVDELHVFGKRANAKSMLDEIEGGLAARPEGFVIYTSTHADEEPSGIFAEKLDEFRAIRDGKYAAPSRLPVLYEFPPDMLEREDYRDPASWRLTNPNLGVSVTPAYLTEKFAEAERAGKQALNLFFAKHLNVQIGQSLLANGWAGAEFWEQAAIEPFDIDAILERCEVVVIGLDGGGLDDLLGVCVLGRERSGLHGASDKNDPHNSRWLAWGRAWVHSRVLELRKSEAPRLLDLAASGDLTIYEEIGEDIAGVVQIVRDVYDSGLLAQIGADPAGITDLVDAINIAIYGEAEPPENAEPLIVGVSQGWTLQLAIKGAERRLAKKSLAHGGQALMGWCVGNAKKEVRGSATYITKAASGTAKIDPLMALFNAVFLMSRNPKPRDASVYSADRGLIVFG